MTKMFPILLVLATLSATFIQAQDLREKQVPKAVLESFSKRYPGEKAYSWDLKRKKLMYEAKFISKGKRYEALFTADGRWVKTEREVKKGEIPDAVWSQFVQSRYANWVIDDQEEHSTPEFDLVYEIKVKNDKQKRLLYFLPDGELVMEK